MLLYMKIQNNSYNILEKGRGILGKIFEKVFLWGDFWKKLTLAASGKPPNPFKTFTAWVMDPHGRKHKQRIACLRAVR